VGYGNHDNQICPMYAGMHDTTSYSILSAKRSY